MLYSNLLKQTRFVRVQNKLQKCMFSVFCCFTREHVYATSFSRSLIFPTPLAREAPRETVMRNTGNEVVLYFHIAERHFNLLFVFSNIMVILPYGSITPVQN